MRQRDDRAITSNETSSPTQIRGSERRSVTAAWVALLIPFFIGCMFYGWAHMPVFFIQPGFPNPLTIILGLVVVIIVGRIGWETIRLKRFGDPVLDLAQAPVPLGGTLEGRITLGASLTTAPVFKLKLQCIHRVLEQGGKNSHWVEKILWTGESTAELLPGGIVPVSMAVPADQEETNTSQPFDQYLWRLTVTAPFRGPAFLEKYEVPIRGRTSEAQRIVAGRAREGNPLATGKVVFLTMLPFFIIGLAIMAGGLYLLTLGIGDVSKARASTNWPTVSGHITRSQYPRGNAIFVSRSDSEFAYAYEVNGTPYIGHIISPHILWPRTAARQLTTTYPPRSAVTVSYSPTDPSNSCLAPGLRAGAFQRVVMALLVLTLGFLFVASAVFAPRDAVASRGSINFRSGTTGSRVMGYSFLVLLAGTIALWWIT